MCAFVEGIAGFYGPFGICLYSSTGNLGHGSLGYLKKASPHMRVSSGWLRLAWVKLAPPAAPVLVAVASSFLERRSIDAAEFSVWPSGWMYIVGRLIITTRNKGQEGGGHKREMWFVHVRDGMGWGWDGRGWDDGTGLGAGVG